MKKPPLRTRFIAAFANAYSVVAACITAAGFLYPFFGIVKNQYTKPILHKTATEDRISKVLSSPLAKGAQPAGEVQHKCESYELKNPGPGTIYTIEVDITVDANYDENQKKFVNGGMEIESDASFSVAYEHDSVSQTIVKLVPTLGNLSCPIYSGQSKTFRIIGPLNNWKVTDISVRVPEDTFHVDDPRSTTGSAVLWLINAFPSIVLIVTGIAFWTMFHYLENRLRAELQEELSEESIGNAESVTSITGVDQAVENLRKATEKLAESLSDKKTV